MATGGDIKVMFEIIRLITVEHRAVVKCEFYPHRYGFNKNGFISIPWMIGLIIMFEIDKKNAHDIFIHENTKIMCSE